jgi:ketosteroid isomerase-like protein
VPAENVDAIRRSYEAFNRGDLDEALEVMHREIEWQTYIVPGPGGGTYHGHDGVRQLWSDARGVFGEFRNEPERFFEAPPDRVVAFIRVCGVGKESGVPVEARIAHLITMKEGMAVRVQSFEDRDEALRVVGLA